MIRYIVKSLHRESDKIRISILELRFSILGQLRTGRRLTPRVNQLIICGYAVKTLESKETKAEGDHGNAQFSLCCTSTAMPDDES